MVDYRDSLPNIKGSAIPIIGLAFRAVSFDSTATHVDVLVDADPTADTITKIMAISGRIPVFHKTSKETLDDALSTARSYLADPETPAGVLNSLLSSISSHGVFVSQTGKVFGIHPGRSLSPSIKTLTQGQYDSLRDYLSKDSMKLSEGLEGKVLSLSGKRVVVQLLHGGIRVKSLKVLTTVESGVPSGFVEGIDGKAGINLVVGPAISGRTSAAYTAFMAASTHRLCAWYSPISEFAYPGVRTNDPAGYDLFLVDDQFADLHEVVSVVKTALSRGAEVIWVTSSASTTAALRDIGQLVGLSSVKSVLFCRMVDTTDSPVGIYEYVPVTDVLRTELLNPAPPRLGVHTSSVQQSVSLNESLQNAVSSSRISAQQAMLITDDPLNMQERLNALAVTSVQEFSAPADSPASPVKESKGLKFKKSKK